MLITVSWLVPPPIELLLKNLITFRNRLRLGAVLNVHKFFRRFVKPFIWFVHYTGFHFFIQTLLQIAVAATYQTSPHLILALVNRMSLFSGCLLLITTLIIFLQNIFFYTLVPLVIIIVFTMIACGIFVIVALKRSLDESNSRKGFCATPFLLSLALPSTSSLPVFFRSTQLNSPLLRFGPRSFPSSFSKEALTLIIVPGDDKTLD